VVNLYGRNISSENNVNHLYLPGPRNGIVNRQAVKQSSTILLSESIIDALTLYDQGFKNVIPAYGVNGLCEDLIFFFNRSNTKEMYLLFDADEAGKKGAVRAAEQLQEQSIPRIHIVTLPEKDINIFFKRHTPLKIG
jgi:DNA primase